MKFSPSRERRRQHRDSIQQSTDGQRRHRVAGKGKGRILYRLQVEPLENRLLLTQFAGKLSAGG